MATTNFDPGTHSYFIDGKRATGVTTIIGVLAKPRLIPWASREAVKYIRVRLEEMRKMISEGANIGQDVMLDTISAWLPDAEVAHTKKKDDAATYGTDAHAIVEKYIKLCIDVDGGNPLIDSIDIQSDDWKDYQPIEPFIRWARENVDHFLYSERQMYDTTRFIAGTADFGCVMKDGRKLIGDFKTSSGVFGIDYFLQCAGYKILAEGEGDTSYDGCVIVRLGKKGPKDFDVTYRYDPKTDEEAFLACLTIYRAQATWKKP